MATTHIVLATINLSEATSINHQSAIKNHQFSLPHEMRHNICGRKKKFPCPDGL